MAQLLVADVCGSLPGQRFSSRRGTDGSGSGVSCYNGSYAVQSTFGVQAGSYLGVRRRRRLQWGVLWHTVCGPFVVA
jgi:hypothetical protein